MLSIEVVIALMFGALSCGVALGWALRGYRFAVRAERARDRERVLRHFYGPEYVPDRAAIAHAERRLSARQP